MKSLFFAKPAARNVRRFLRVETLEDRAVPAAELSITPLTWNAVGLDSNDVSAGPDQYLVGARVTNSGDTTATNVAADFFWDSDNPYLNLIDASRLSIGSLAAGSSQDFYFNVRVTRDVLAFDTTRQFHITAQADAVSTVSTPNTSGDYRELYVEKILSQARNSINGLTGPTSVVLGQTVTYTLSARTAAAYPQLTVFAGFDNRIFQIESVATTYSSPGTTNSSFYADATLWQANPTLAGYNDTTSVENPAFPGGNVGGTVITTVVARIIGTGSVTLIPTVNDYSGASFHYNADFPAGTLIVTATSATADLHVTKSVDNATPNVGDNVTFTVTVSNEGPSEATGVQVTDLLPTGLSFVSATPSVGTYDSSSGLWDIGSVPSASLVTLQISATVTSSSAVTNFAQISRSDVFDPDPTDNSSSAAVDPQLADLAVDVAASNVNPLVGETVTLTITLTNVGPDLATGVQVADLLPAGMQFVSASPEQGTYDSGAGVWQVGALPSGQSLTLSIQATVTRPGSFNDLASVSDVDQFDPNTANNSDDVDLSAAAPAISSPSPLTLPENSAGGTAAGTLSIAGLDPSNSVTWTLLDNAGGRFVIVGDQLEAVAGADLNFEADTTQPIRVQATDEFGNTYEEDLIVGVTDVNEAPVNTVPGTQFVPRNGALTFSSTNGNALAVADVDRPGSSIRTTLSIPAGTGTLTLPLSPAAVVVTGNGTATITIEGTPAAIAEALNGLIYRPPFLFVGSVPLTVSTDDLAHNFFSSALTDVDVIQIQVGNTRPQPTRTALTYQLRMATLRQPTRIAQGLASYFTDVNRDPLTYHLVGGTPRGLQFRPNGTFVYRPPVGFVGTVRFRVRAFDGLEFSDPILVTIRVVYGIKPCGR